MAKIIITGSDGFLASRFVSYYRNRHEVSGFSSSQLDITNANQTLQIIKSVNPDYIVHAAAISDIGTCENNPELSHAVNVQGSINVARAAQACNAGMFYLSSDQVYIGNSGSEPHREDDQVNPHNIYGQHKLAAESAVLDLMPQAIVLRLTLMFGIPEPYKKTKPNPVWNILQAAIRNQKISFPVYDFRSVTYVYEVIANIEKMFNLAGGIYNAGSENNLNMYELAKIVFAAAGIDDDRTGLLLQQDTERFKDKPRNLRVNNQKLKSCGVTFSDSAEGIRQCLADFSLSQN